MELRLILQVHIFLIILIFATELNSYHIDNLYIAEQGNSCVRKVAYNIISTIAGTGTSGYSGDGDVATSAYLRGPVAVAIDSASGQSSSHHF